MSIFIEYIASVCSCDFGASSELCMNSDRIDYTVICVKRWNYRGDSLNKCRIDACITTTMFIRLMLLLSRGFWQVI